MRQKGLSVLVVTLVLAGLVVGILSLFRPGEPVKMTFIKPTSPSYRRLNQEAPSDSGATALIMASTLMSPRTIISRQAGYSPPEAHEP